MRSGVTLLVVLLGFLLIAIPAGAQTTLQPGEYSGSGCWCPPPRFQMFDAPGPYGGTIMVDTKTGETYQRVIVSSPKGIAIRWLKLKKVDELPEEEKLIWE